MKNLNCILLVDDDRSTNILNRIIIEKLNARLTVKFASTGEEALSYFQQYLDEGEPDFPNPDLVLLDINMPRMNGWEFLEAYREGGFHDNDRVIVVMLTNSLNQGDADRASRIPEVSGYAKKPLTERSMKSLIEKYFGKGALPGD